MDFINKNRILIAAAAAGAAFMGIGLAMYIIFHSASWTDLIKEKNQFLFPKFMK